MIAYLQGSVPFIEDDHVVLLVNGVGYKVYVPFPSLYQDLESEASLFIETKVRENDISLYGFQSAEEQVWFERLCSVNSIGPKAAMSILKLGCEEFNDRIWNGEVSFFTRANGVGKRGAEKIIADLKKFASEPSMSVAALANRKKLKEQSLKGMKALGYTVAEINKAHAAVFQVEDHDFEKMSVADFTKLCVKELS